jgi:hypothetical protein
MEHSRPNRLQMNFYIRIRDRLIWNRAKELAKLDGVSLYVIITKLLKEWVSNA